MSLIHYVQTAVSIVACKPLVCVLNEIAALEAQRCMCRRAIINHRRSGSYKIGARLRLTFTTTVRTWTRVKTFAEFNTRS